MNSLQYYCYWSEGIWMILQDFVYCRYCAPGASEAAWCSFWGQVVGCWGWCLLSGFAPSSLFSIQYRLFNIRVIASNYLTEQETGKFYESIITIYKRLSSDRDRPCWKEKKNRTFLDQESPKNLSKDLFSDLSRKMFPLMHSFLSVVAEMLYW